MVAPTYKNKTRIKEALQNFVKSVFRESKMKTTGNFLSQMYSAGYGFRKVRTDR